MAASSSVLEGLAIKSENVDYTIYGRTVSNEGVQLQVPEIKEVRGTAEENAKSFPADKGWEVIQQTTIRIHKAGTFEGILELMGGDKEEAVAIFNRGVSQKTGQKIKRITDFDATTGTLTFDFSEPIIDTIEWLREPTQTRGGSPLEKAIRQIQTLNPNNFTEEEKLQLARILGLAL